MSLDGFIAGTGDEFDWIVIDPDIDIKELPEQFDTFLLGRRTFELTGGKGLSTQAGARTFVFSITLNQIDHQDVGVIGENWQEVVRSLRAESGKDIWLFGGGALFGRLCEEGLVDTVEVTIVPTLLGSGKPLVAGLSRPVELELIGQGTYEKTGTVGLVYEV